MSTKPLDFTNAKWVKEVARWNINQAIGCRHRNGPSSPEYAEMHDTCAAMLTALLEKLEKNTTSHTVRYTRMKVRQEPDSNTNELYKIGDCIPVWVNEGDILTVGEEVKVDIE